jgi:dynein heavy chain
VTKQADDQKKAVSARKEKISVEAAATQQLAANAQHDLDEAMPALEAAMAALDSLNKGDITEVKSYNKPPPLVALVMEGVMTLRKQKTDWAGDSTFLGVSPRGPMRL